ncbi:MAG: hypothetical protein NT011_02450 [Kiritimatiellaeota bacterium]|nr:hypothetical protein [Kiritimatiellota bacterium]
MNRQHQHAQRPRIVDVRPYQLLCLVCRLGTPPGRRRAAPPIIRLQRLIQENPNRPLRLVCNVDGIYRYQNPGHRLDSIGGALFNEKRDLDILQRMGMAPGDTRPARDLIERLLQSIKTTRNLCGYAGDQATPTWRGCPQALRGAFERGSSKALATLIPRRPSREKATAKKTTAAAMYRVARLQIRPHHLMCMACFYSRQAFAPIAEDNLYEALDIMRKNPAIPVTLVRGCCMICPPCSTYDAATGLCVGGNGMSLRDQKKDLDVLRRLDLNYGDTLPARTLYAKLFRRIRTAQEICGFQDGIARGEAWTICGCVTQQAYERSRSSGMGIAR